MFSIIGYMFFKDDFLVSVDEEVVGKTLLYFSLYTEGVILICITFKNRTAQTFLYKVIHVLV